jgi:hypothetical protein
VLQLPSIIVQGTSESEVREKLGTTTFNYLKRYEDDHQRLIENPHSMLSIDAGFGYGTTVGTKQFKVTC